MAARDRNREPVWFTIESEGLDGISWHVHARPDGPGGAY